MGPLWQELKRRNVVRVAVAYAILGWLLLQVISVVLPTFEAPAWVAKTLMFAIFLGFPVALFLAWAFELTPEGIKPTTTVKPEDSITPATGHKLNRFIIITLVLALVLVAFDAYLLTDNTDSQSTATVVTEATPDNAAQDTTQIQDKSIAVLPFANLSSDPEQDYFADGLSEELLNHLAQLSDLQVAGRTSSFFYKGRNEDLRTIGETLGVAHILEGSVRKSGNNVRITAQLIKADDGFHLWSETFDRELTEIFAIQDEIARAVTTALSVTLGAGEFDRPGMTRNLMAYDAYLRGQAANDSFNSTPMQLAVEFYREAVELDPQFALAWIQMGRTYDDARATLPYNEAVALEPLAQQALQRGHDLAPEMLEARLYSVYNLRNNVNWMALGNELESLVGQYEHSNAAVNLEYGLFLRNLGRLNEALPYLNRARRLDPLNIEASYFLASTLYNLNKLSEADAEVQFGLDRGNWDDQFYFLKMQEVYARGEDPALAVDYSEKIMEAFLASFSGPAPDYAQEFPEPGLVRDGKTGELKAGLEELVNSPDFPMAVRGGQALFAVEIGAAELALQYMKTIDGRLDFNYPHVWHDMYSDVRKLSGFKQVLMDEGLLDYWRRTNAWPDKCRPLNDNDFECF